MPDLRMIIGHPRPRSLADGDHLRGPLAAKQWRRAARKRVRMQDQRRILGGIRPTTRRAAGAAAGEDIEPENTGAFSSPLLRSCKHASAGTRSGVAAAAGGRRKAATPGHHEQPGAERERGNSDVRAPQNNVRRGRERLEDGAKTKERRTWHPDLGRPAHCARRMRNKQRPGGGEAIHGAATNRPTRMQAFAATTTIPAFRLASKSSRKDRVAMMGRPGGPAEVTLPGRSDGGEAREQARSPGWAATAHIGWSLAPAPSISTAPAVWKKFAAKLRPWPHAAASGACNNEQGRAGHVVGIGVDIGGASRRLRLFPIQRGGRSVAVHKQQTTPHETPAAGRDPRASTRLLKRDGVGVANVSDSWARRTPHSSLTP